MLYCCSVVVLKCFVFSVDMMYCCSVVMLLLSQFYSARVTMNCMSYGSDFDNGAHRQADDISDV